MSLFRKLAVLGAAAEFARRYARKNPEKARELTEKAARFADQQTKGKYHGQIESARNKIADAGGFGGQGHGPNQPGPEHRS
ncbi:antitoxin [Pseudonocardia acaciae]|uniref:antitoxin n=1 Tax=Pseudonocardia acaciae TaxID=551276 RepID=UPI00055EF2A5|nr:antitoxin [Pseudonocardia acaciae]